MHYRIVAITLWLLSTPALQAQDSKDLPSIADHTAGMVHHEGFMDLYWDDAGGKVLLAVDRLEQPLLYVTALAAGVGSNDIGLDRGQLGWTRMVEFQRVGRRVLMIEPNLYYRAESDNPDEQRAVAEAFAQSIIAGFKVVAEADDTALIDITDLLLTDAHGIGNRLTGTEQGSYQPDAKRSAPLPASLKSFPMNTVAEALVTFKGSKPGREISSVTPTPEALSVRMQHQFVALPDDGFERRPYHPRSGFFSFQFRDYAVPLGESIDRRYLVRHRLETDDQGNVVEPLVYYVDRGAPEPIRSALIEGASWWADAFEAAGFPGGYRVEVLPEGVDPLDVRYNVIQWVHRSTRGWSYGASVRDPRTGEIIKGHISLGSLRVRQDMLIAEGLLAPFETGQEAAAEVEQMALARLRQLSAHEVGHTLGLAHNFAASVSNDASVMDYPHPFVRLQDGSIQIDRAYDTGIGEWDKLAIEFGYREFADESARRAGLQALLDRADREGLQFISDPDSRGFGKVHAVAHLWDNGAEPLTRFEELMAIRRLALEGFSPAVLREGEPLSDMEKKLVPIYLVHRYQAEAVAKMIAGLDYDYRMRGDGPTAIQRVAPEQQNAAIDALIAAMAPSELSLRSELLDQLLPAAYGHRKDREFFTHRTADAFDAWAPARAAAQMLAQMLLEPARAERLDQHHESDPASPNAEDLIERLTAQRVIQPLRARNTDPLAETVAWIVTRELQRLMVDPRATDRTRATARSALADIARQLNRGAGAGIAAEINRFLQDPDAVKLPPREVIPPGSPI